MKKKSRLSKTIKEMTNDVKKVNQKFVKETIELDNDTILRLALEAHTRDITLNQLINEILEYALEQMS